MTRSTLNSPFNRNAGQCREIDPLALNRLVMHDVENYVGVTERRNSEREFALGYTSWWLTLDPAAFAARSVLIDPTTCSSTRFARHES